MRINSRFRIQMNYISLKFSSCIRFQSRYRWTRPQCWSDHRHEWGPNHLPKFHALFRQCVQRVSSRLKIFANVADCQALCMNTPRCLSVNAATHPGDEQRHLCQMLDTTKNSEPDRFGPSETFHHYNTIVSDPFSIIPECPYCICNCTDWFQIANLSSLMWSFTILATHYIHLMFHILTAAITSHFTLRQVLSLRTSQVAHQAGAYPGFCSMKRLGVFLLPPGWDASPSQGYPQH